MRGERRAEPRTRPAGAGHSAEPRRDGARILHPGLLAARPPPLRCSGRPWPSGSPRSPRGRSSSRSPVRRACCCSRCLCSGIRRFRWPSAAAARARIDATLPGRPLATLRDTPALGLDDPGAQAVWAAHLARMRRLAATARAGARRSSPREPRSLGAAAGGAGGADRRRRLRARSAGSGRSRRRCSRRRAPRSRPGRASRAGPSRRPIPGARRSICRRCRVTSRCRCPRAPR